VLDAINKLRSFDIDFEFKLLVNTSNSEVINELLTSDIVIDQPGVWAGRFAIEACAAGCCVVGGNQPKYTLRYNSPIIQFVQDSDQLANILLELIKDKKRLKIEMDKCYTFWDQNYSYSSFIKFYNQLILGNTSQFNRINDYKMILLNAANNIFERLIIKWFY